MTTELQNVSEFVTSDDLAYEVTLGYFDNDNICLRYGIRHADLDAIKIDPGFMVLCQNAAKQISEDGDDFKMKAQKYSLKVLEQLNEIALDNMDDGAELAEGEMRVPIPLGQRMKAGELIARYAGYDKQANQVEVGGMKLVLQTNLGLGPLTTEDVYVIEAKPVPEKPVISPENPAIEELI